MALDTLVRIIDVKVAAKGCAVVYTIEDDETSCAWEGTPPKIGDIFMIDMRHPGRDARKLASPLPGARTNESDVMRWRRQAAPTGSLSRMEVLRRRHIIRRAARDYFDGQDFLEIDVPLLVHGASPDMAIDSFKVEDRYLISSSEYQLRRLTVGGFPRTYSLTKNFRRGDGSGSTRNPEFTMLEWGRAGADMLQIENDLEYLLSDALRALHMPNVISYLGKKIDLKYPWDRLSVAEAIERYAGAPMPDFELASCRKAAEAAGLEIRASWADNRDFLFSLVMDAIQPRLGEDRPVFLNEWPLFQTTTAAPLAKNPALAERSELFVAGIEIADGFADLSDAELQERLFNEALELRVREGKDAVDLDQKYIEAMKLGYPPGAAMALGFDRLVMLLTGQENILSTLAFGWDEV
jgi:lysyl-tRNA synthetase class 2